MKDRKRRFETFSFYDRTGIEAHLKKMAEKGWMISEMTTLGWIYKRVEPESLTFAVSYYPKASEFDPEPTEGQNIYHDLSSRTGWQFVCSSAQMQVFCTTDDKPIPIETDPALEVEMIHRSAKKGFLLSYYILLAVGVLNGALFISRLLGDPIGVLASPTNLFTGVAWTMLMLLCGVELIGYYRWRSKALKAADRGEFVDTPNHAQFQKLVLAVVFIALFYWLINVVAVGDTLMKWVSILMLLYFFGLIVIVNTVKQLLKRKKASRGTNFAITMTVDIVLAVVLMAGITFGTLYAVRNGIFQNEENYETYEFHGSTQILYQDELPLRVEDMHSLCPDSVIAVDVCHAKTIGCKEYDRVHEFGCGAVIAYGMNSMPRFAGTLERIALKNGIPYEREALPGKSFTDAWVAQTANKGARTAVVSIPLRHMHTPVEIIDLRDAAAVTELLKETCLVWEGLNDE